MIETVVLLGVLVALAAWVAAPLYRAAPAVGRGDHSEVEARREALLAALRELEWDHRSGLTGDAEYRRHKAELEAEAANTAGGPADGNGHD